jgi:hypothetical protein
MTASAVDGTLTANDLVINGDATLCTTLPTVTLALDTSAVSVGQSATGTAVAGTADGDFKLSPAYTPTATAPISLPPTSSDIVAKFGALVPPVTVTMGTITSAVTSYTLQITFSGSTEDQGLLLPCDPTSATADSVFCDVTTIVEGGPKEEYAIVHDVSETLAVEQILSYSCDTTVYASNSQTVGWEVTTVDASDSALAVTVDVAKYLWNENQPYSFLNQDVGFNEWYKAGEATTAVAAKDNLLVEVPGITVQEVASVAQWLTKTKSRRWLTGQLKERWRLADLQYSVGGYPGLTQLDLDPNQAGLQKGWEVAVATNRSTYNSGYFITTAAADYLWDTTQIHSFLNTKGYNTWLLTALTNGETELCSSLCTSGLGCSTWPNPPCMVKAREDIALALNALSGGSLGSTWQEWMESVSKWLRAFSSEDVTVNDVLGKWLQDKCLASTANPPNDTTTLVTTLANTASSVCVPNVTHTQLGVVSYQTSEQYLDTEPVFDSRSPKVNQTSVMKSETVTCLVSAISNGTITKTVTTNIYTERVFSCDVQDLSTQSGIQAGFELNPLGTGEQPTVTLTAARMFWSPSSPVSFLKQSTFNVWKDSLEDTSLEAFIINKVNATDLTFQRPQLVQVRSWLLSWASNPLMATDLQSSWATRNKLAHSAPIDLDTSEEGIQPGFEVNWEQKKGATPSIEHAEYVWNVDKPYSFLNPGVLHDPSTGGATGFFAWCQLFSGEFPATTNAKKLADGTYISQRTTQQKNVTLMNRVIDETNTLPPCVPPHNFRAYSLNISIDTSGAAGYFNLTFGTLTTEQIANNAATSVVATAIQNVDFGSTTNFSILIVEGYRVPHSSGGFNYSFELFATNSWASFYSTLYSSSDTVDVAIVSTGTTPVYKTKVYVCPARNGLTEAIIDQIATWLFSWADNAVLLNYVNEIWADKAFRTNAGGGWVPTAPFNLNDMMGTGTYLISNGFPRPNPATGWEMTSRDPSCANTTLGNNSLVCTPRRHGIQRHHMNLLWDVSSPVSFLNPEGFERWRKVHRGNAPETGLLDSQRVRRVTDSAELKQLIDLTDKVPRCFKNGTVTLNVSYVTPMSSYITSNGTICTPGNSSTGCYEVSELCSDCQGSNGVVSSAICGGPGFDNNQCRLNITSDIDYTVVDGGEKGTYTQVRNTSRIHTYYAVAVNGAKFMLNTSTRTKMVYFVCPARNGMAYNQIVTVAEWLMGMADHPLLLSRVQQRWWQQLSSSTTSTVEKGFELHLTYPGELYMSSFQDRSLLLASEAFQVQVPAAVAAYLWDVRNTYSFLNMSNFHTWVTAMNGDAKSLAIIASSIPYIYTNGNNEPGTIGLTRNVTKHDDKILGVVIKWLQSWAVHPLLQNTLQLQWRLHSTVADSDILYWVPHQDIRDNAQRAGSMSAWSTIQGGFFTTLDDPSLDSGFTEYTAGTQMKLYYGTQAGLYYQRTRPVCTDLDSIRSGCQEGMELKAPLLPNASIVAAEQASVLWDPADVRSFLNKDGFVAWTEGLLGCDSSEAVTGLCEAGKNRTEESKQRRKSAQSYLVNSTGIADVFVEHIRDTWMLSWLDNIVLEESPYMLGSFLSEGVKTVIDLAYIQLGNASVTRRAFVPTLGERWLRKSSIESEKMITTRRYFKPGLEGSTTNGVAAVEVLVPPLNGYGYPEFVAFTQYGAINNSKSYQQFETATTALDLPTTTRLMSVFTDSKLVSENSAAASLRVTRGILALMYFLEQPYADMSVCSTRGERLKAEFAGDLVFSSSVVSRSNVSGSGIQSITQIGVCQQHLQVAQGSKNGWYLTGVYNSNQSVTDADLLKDIALYDGLRVYVKYMATKFVWEPDILDKGGGYFTTQLAADMIAGGYTDPLEQKFKLAQVTTAVPATVFNAFTKMSWPLSATFSFYDNTTAQVSAERALPRTCGRGNWNSGSDQWSKIGQLVAWDGQSETDVWETLSSVQGSDGTQFEPGLTDHANPDKKKSEYNVWWPEALRPMPVNYAKDITRYGVKLQRFTCSNLLQYSDGSDWFTPLNLIDLRRAHNGLPLYLGFPHFLNGVISSVRDGVIGLQPLRGDHETVLDVEPMTGMAMNSRKKIQYNLQIARTSIWYKNVIVPHCDSANSAECVLFLPLYWSNKEGGVSFEEAKQFKDQIYQALEMKEKIPVGSFFVGSLAMGASFVSALQGLRAGSSAATQVAPNAQGAIESVKLMSAVP